MKSIKFLLISFIFMCLTCRATAQETGLELLTLGPGTKALGFNEAVTAELLGAASLYSNPANLTLEQSSSINADYTLWIGDLAHTQAGINLKKDSRALAFGFIGSQVGNIALRDQAGPADGSFNVSFLSLSGGYAYDFGPIAFGGTIQYLREEYYIYNASGYAANLGTAARFWDNRLQLGTSLLNLGEMNELQTEATTLPTMFRAGFDVELVTFTPPKNQDLPVTLNVKNDWVIPTTTPNSTTQAKSSSEPYTNIALEFDIANTVILRSGYKTGNTVRHWSAGAGIEAGAITANYAMIPFETGFGTVHSVGISYRFE